jgi:hypothetical protein
MNGSKTIQQGGLGMIPTTQAVTITGDFSYDGDSDVLWRDNSGNLAIWLWMASKLS